MVSWNSCQAHLQETGLTQILGDHETLSIVCYVGLHVDFSSMKSSSGLQAFTFVCEVNFNGLRPFNQWELLDCNGHGPSALCVKWPWVSHTLQAMGIELHISNEGPLTLSYKDM